MKKCNVVIPARAGSKGIIDKNIIDFCGRPLISWSIEQALSAECVANVYVSTDGEKIAQICEKVGAKVIWRPEDLATDTSSTEDALLHVLSQIEADSAIDTMMLLQATSPLRRQTDLDAAMKAFEAGGYDSLFSMAILDDYCIWKKDKELFSFTYDYEKRGRRQDRQPLYLENGSIYIFSYKILKKYRNRLGGKIGMYEMPFHLSYEIDGWKDVRLCEYFMKNLREER